MRLSVQRPRRRPLPDLCDKSARGVGTRKSTSGTGDGAEYGTCKTGEYPESAERSVWYGREVAQDEKCEEFIGKVERFVFRE